MTKLAAPRFVGQVMGMWFLSIALGNDLAGQLATEYDASNLASMPALFPQDLRLGRGGGVGISAGAGTQAAHGRFEAAAHPSANRDRVTGNQSLCFADPATIT